MNNIVTIVKSVFAAVKAIEATFPTSPGKDKFDAALAMISEAAGVAVASTPGIEAIINTAVGLLNLFGAFRKSLPSAALPN